MLCEFIPNMRATIEAAKKHRSKTFSLAPNTFRDAKIKSFKAGISFSEYINRLILLDLKNKLIPLPKG